MSDTGSLNLAWADALVAGFAAAGVRHAVLSPGSRSTPLALALLRRPELRVHVVLDERCAAFFALGLAKADDLPVLLLATSGSAPANWLPTLVEADAGHTPLIAFSADRPPEVQGWGANQTIPQARLFADFVRAGHALGTPYPGFSPDYLHRLAARAVSESRWPRPGPVHINLPLREPLMPTGAATLPPPALPDVTATPIQTAVPAAEVTDLAARLAGQPGVILVGNGRYPLGFADAVATLATRLEAPLLAEPLSGLRFGGPMAPTLCTHQETWLGSACPPLPEPAWILRFGTWPTSRSVGAWLAGTCHSRHFVVAGCHDWPDPEHRAYRLFQGDPEQLCVALAQAVATGADPVWQLPWLEREHLTARLADAVLTDDVLWEPAIHRHLVSTLPAGHRLFCGNSMAIRDFDSFSGRRRDPLAVFGNRGASGIDGNLSTAAGIAAAQGPTVAIVGDLTAAHDLGGLATVRGLDLIIIVLNNGGGGIFDYLPQASLPEDIYRQAWLTPTTVDFVQAAQAQGLPACRVDTLLAFKTQLAAALSAGGPHLIEVTIDRAVSRQRHVDFRRAVSESGE